MKQSKTFASGFPVEETIESLRQQLAEQATEIEQLKAVAFQAQNAAIDLNKQLAAGQAREQQLREALNHHHEIGFGRGRDKSHSLSQLIISGYKHGLLCRITEQALTLPSDATALSSMIAKAGEVMRERCLFEADIAYHNKQCCDEIRALPGVTLEDIK